MAVTVQGRRDRTWVAVVAVLVAVATAARLVDLQQVAWLRSMLVVFGSLLVEALPFVALGALVSAAIEVLVPS